MSASSHEISTYLEQLFNYSAFNDSSLNGLQVDSGKEISKIGAAVDFGLSTAQAAAIDGVDLLITHHGLLWGANNRLVGTFGEKVKYLFDNYISLVGIHLPLDAHETYGNNAIISKKILGLESLTPAVPYGSHTIGWKGENSSKKNLIEMAEILSDVPGGLASPLIFAFGPSVPEKVCVVSGGAADSLYLYQSEGYDTLITGEPKQFAYHFCKENKINAIFAGHYATETFGVRATAEHLAEKFKLDWTFIDEPTGI